MAGVGNQGVDALGSDSGGDEVRVIQRELETRDRPHQLQRAFGLLNDRLEVRFDAHPQAGAAPHFNEVGQRFPGQGKRLFRPQLVPDDTGQQRDAGTSRLLAELHERAKPAAIRVARCPVRRIGRTVPESVSKGREQIRDAHTRRIGGSAHSLGFAPRIGFDSIGSQVPARRMRAEIHIGNVQQRDLQVSSMRSPLDASLAGRAADTVTSGRRRIGSVRTRFRPRPCPLLVSCRGSRQPCRASFHSPSRDPVWREAGAPWRRRSAAR